MKQEEVNILYEDNHLLGLNKPSNLLTQPTNLSQNALENSAKDFIKKRDQKKANVFLHAVHRLDKPTSGIVLFAKSQKGLSKMTQSFRNREVKKTYLAITQKVPKQKKLHHHLEHQEFKATQSEKGKECLLTFDVLEEKKGLYLLQIDLITGRYHQIRAQFGSEGCPIIGDTKYGSTLKTPLHLHCSQLQFTHPIQKKEIVIQAPIPKNDKWSIFK